jgi:hypothetical protein
VLPILGRQSVTVQVRVALKRPPDLYQCRSQTDHTTEFSAQTRPLTCNDMELAKVGGGRVEYVSVNSCDDGKRAGVTHASHPIRTGTNPKAAPQSSPKSQVSGLYDKKTWATNCTCGYCEEAKNFSVSPLRNTDFD